MSSAADATTTVVVGDINRQTYWCHECDMSIYIVVSSTSTTTSTPLCPYCRNDFLEELDHPRNPHTTPDPNPINSDSISPHPHPLFSQFPLSINHHDHNNINNNNNNDNNDFPFTSSTATATVTAGDDNFLLDSPYLHRLIHQLAATDAAPSAPVHQNATSKSAIEAIPTITITEALLKLDSVIFCAVCKDQFSIDSEAKQLPCNHIYHQDCILPWLKTHNSCPICRFKMPTESGGGGYRVRRRRERFSNARLGEIFRDEEFFGFGSTLRHIARRHRLVFPVSGRGNGVEVVEGSVEESMLLSPTQVAEAEMGVLGRENSVETVSSGWPMWPVEGEVEDLENGVVGASGRGNDGADAM